MCFSKSIPGLAGTSLLAMLTVFSPFAAPVTHAQTLRAVMHSDLKILDPIWTTAYIARNHGYMVYDTLLAMNEKFEITPQMVDKYEVSADKLTYTFTLRDGLKWHDGTPVTAEDCIASLKRWAAKDGMGQKLMAFTKEMTAADAKTFKLILKEPYGLVLQSIAKPSSNVPFMMPKRVADTDPNTQISEFIGSGPFIFKKEEWKPGDKAVYIKSPDYKPRSETPSWMAGGKIAKIDRVEWLVIPDSQTAVNALLAGEIDMLEQPPIDLLPVLKKDKNIGLVDTLGNQYTMRINWLQPPFNNQKIREAVTYALNQEDFLKAAVGDPEYYKVCKAMFICGSPLAMEAGMQGRLQSDFAKSKALLKEAGYDGTPVTLLHSTDLQILTNLAPVAKSLLEKGGFKVDMISMDWQSVVARRAKKDPPSQGGWNAFLTSWNAADVANPLSAAFFIAACDKALYGWPCDEEIEKLRDQYAREGDLEKQKEIVAKLQTRAIQQVTHINLGQWYQPIAYRKDKVSGWLVTPAPAFWNVTKKGS